jgi:succinate dehydrogenase / fumarate reductase flavoprotein subunit
MKIKGSRTVRDIHWDLGRVMWDKVGMARNKDGLTEAIATIKGLQQSFRQDLALTGREDDLNKQLEQANRLGDYLELGELMARDALMREESCGGHFREEHQTPEGEAKRDDDNFMFVSAWEHKGQGQDPVMHKEDLAYENIEVKTRSYK